jgi:hypothetical protein
MLLTNVIIYQDFYVCYSVCILCHTCTFILCDFLSEARMDYMLDDSGLMVHFQTGQKISFSGHPVWV